MSICGAATVRVTTWNLNWFPNGTPKELPPQEQAQRIAKAADVLRPLNSDILLLQEVRDYDVCQRLAEAITPHTYQLAICSAFREGSGIGKQQVAILAKDSAQAAWSEPWKSMEGVDPPRGFAFAWFKLKGADVGVYAVHLKSNLVMHGDKATEGAKNIHKREVAARQLLEHMRDVITTAMPNVRSIIVGGDFNTNSAEFANELTLKRLVEAGFANCMGTLPPNRRVTHPGGHGYPDTTFDYILARNASLGPPQITLSHASDHLPVTCEVEVVSTPVQLPPSKNESPPPPSNASPSPSVSTEPQIVTLTQPVKIKIAYGETVLPRGMKLPILSRDATTVRVQYMGKTQTIPVSATDLR